MGKPPGMNRAFVSILAALFTYFMETNNFRWAVFYSPNVTYVACCHLICLISDKWIPTWTN